jgi:hypothetical protein
MALDPSIDAAMRYVADMTFVGGSFDGCVVLDAEFEDINLFRWIYVSVDSLTF